MFNTLRDELNKISLMESDDLEMINDHTMDGDEGAADDELYDDLEECEDEEDLDDIDDQSMNEAIDMIVNEMLLNEAMEDYEDYDDYDYYDEDDDIFDDDYDDDDFDDDDDEVDMDHGVIGDGKTVTGSPDDDEYDEVDINGVTNSIHGDVDLNEDIEDDEEDDLDELLEAILFDEECNGSDLDGCDHTVRATTNDIFGDSADMPRDDVPPAPQYSKMFARNKVGGMIPNYGAGNYGTYGKTCLDKDVMGSMTVDDDEYDEEGNAYDLYASAGNIYDDDENEEYYGIRNRVSTKNLYGRHNINNINYAQLGDRFGGTKDALDESVEMYLRGLDY